MNYSALESNVLLSIAGAVPDEFVEEAQSLFMRAAEKRSDDLMLYRAEKCAIEWGIILSQIGSMVEEAAKQYGISEDVGLIDFMRERQYRRYYAGN